jgi:hypothetical protein
MHQAIPEQGKWLRQVVAGHFAYYAVPTNSRALSAFRHYVTDLWRHCQCDQKASKPVVRVATRAIKFVGRLEAIRRRSSE